MVRPGSTPPAPTESDLIRTESAPPATIAQTKMSKKQSSQRITIRSWGKEFATPKSFAFEEAGRRGRPRRSPLRSRNRQGRLSDRVLLCRYDGPMENGSGRHGRISGRRSEPFWPREIHSRINSRPQPRFRRINRTVSNGRQASEHSGIAAAESLPKGGQELLRSSRLSRHDHSPAGRVVPANLQIDARWTRFAKRAQPRRKRMQEGRVPSG